MTRASPPKKLLPDAGFHMFLQQQPGYTIHGGLDRGDLV